MGELVSHEWKVESACDAERVPAPRSRVHVEQLGLTVPAVRYELHLDHASEAQPGQQLLCQFDQAGHLDSLYKTAAQPVVDGGLTGAAGGAGSSGGAAGRERGRQW